MRSSGLPMKQSKPISVLSAQDVKRNLERMAREILKQQKSTEALAFIGIRTRGAFLARRLRDIIRKATGKELPIGEMDISLYRDDLNTLLPKGAADHTQIPFDINNK